MIKIVVSKSCDGCFEALCVKGHAGYAAKGEDIVCSGVSAIVLGGLNAIKENSDFEIEVKEGFVEGKALKKISSNDSVVLETVTTQLESLACSYPEYVKLERKTSK